MHLAAKNNHTAVLEFLIENGATLDPKDNSGLTPLLYAVLNKHIPAIEILLKNGVLINAQATITPLSAAKLLS